MGQKVNPIGFRVGVNHAWGSRWFAPKKTFGALLVEDQKIREACKKQLAEAGISKILIERYANRVRVTLFSARPGVIIGRKGDDVEAIRAKRLRLVIVGSITIDCRNGQTDPMSEAFLQMAGVFSQLELAMIRARVKSGMENAKAKGKHIGRRPTTKDDIPAVFYKHYPAYMAGSMNVSELARVCGLSRPTVYKYLRMIA